MFLTLHFVINNANGANFSLCIFFMPPKSSKLLILQLQSVNIILIWCDFKFMFVKNFVDLCFLNCNSKATIDLLFNKPLNKLPKNVSKNKTWTNCIVLFPAVQRSDAKSINFSKSGKKQPKESVITVCWDNCRCIQTCTIQTQTGTTQKQKYITKKLKEHL